MREYHKILTVFKRNPETKFKTLLEGEFASTEFDYLKQNNWIFTEKIDGTCIRIMWMDGKVILGGKTDNAQIPTFLIKKLQEMFTVEELSSAFPDSDVCLYGEGYGAKIQKGGSYIPDGVSFILFDVLIGDWWLKRYDVEDIANKLNISTVPIVGNGTLYEGIEMARAGFSSSIGSSTAEGLVMRPEIELKDRSGHRIITKIKNKDFI